MTTGFIAETPSLFEFVARQDRATKLLTYIGEVVVNGNPEVSGKRKQTVFKPAPIPARDLLAPPPGTRQLDPAARDDLRGRHESQR